MNKSSFFFLSIYSPLLYKERPLKEPRRAHTAHPIENDLPDLSFVADFVLDAQKRILDMVFSKIPSSPRSLKQFKYLFPLYKNLAQ